MAAGPRTGRDGEAKGEGEKKTTRVERGEDGMMDTAMEVGDGGDGALDVGDLLNVPRA